MGLHLPAVRETAWCRGAFLGEELAGVLVAAPPGAWPLPAPPPGARLAAALRLGPGVVRRQARLSEALERRHPPGARWVLSLLGVAPARAGRGVGRALLEDWLRQVDAEGESAYLETDVASNLAFYARAGFGTRDVFRVLDVPVWALERPTRRPAVPARGVPEEL